MLKCPTLARWFKLSDPSVEEALRDPISFRRFAGLSLIDATPKEKAFVRFRDRLLEAGLHLDVFDPAVACIE